MYLVFFCTGISTGSLLCSIVGGVDDYYRFVCSGSSFLSLAKAMDYSGRGEVALDAETRNLVREALDHPNPLFNLSGNRILGINEVDYEDCGQDRPLRTAEVIHKLFFAPIRKTPLLGETDSYNSLVDAPCQRLSL